MKPSHIILTAFCIFWILLTLAILIYDKIKYREHYRKVYKEGEEDNIIIKNHRHEKGRRTNKRGHGSDAKDAERK